jgi:hypothetical protein
MNYWIGDTLRAAREEGGVPLPMIAGVLDVHPRTVERIEDAGDARGYGADMDRVVAAYALVLGIEDSRDLWERAIQRWREEVPEAPDFTAGLPGARFVLPIREAARQQAQARLESEGKATAKRTKREAG